MTHMRYLLLSIMLCAAVCDAARGEDVPLGLGPQPSAAAIYTGGAVPATTQVVYSDGTSLTGDSAFTRGTLTLGVDPNTDNAFTTGYGKMGLASGGGTTSFFIAQASNFNSTDYALAQTSAGITNINAKGAQSILFKGGGSTTRATFGSAGITFASGFPVTINDATASTTTGTGCLILSGGLGVAGSEFIGGNLSVNGNITMTANAASFAMSAGGTAFFTSSSAARWYRSGGTITPNAGDMVFQTGDTAARDFYFVGGTTPTSSAKILADGTLKTLGGPIFTATADAAVTNTVTETSLLGAGVGTKTLAANTLAAGKHVRITVRGFMSSTANPTANIKIKLGSVVICTSGAVAQVGTPTSKGFKVTADITCRTTGASGTVYGQGDWSYSTNEQDVPATAAATVDTTAAQAVDVTLTWGTAAAGNTATATDALIEVY